jgi:hypothetical protein
MLTSSTIREPSSCKATRRGCANKPTAGASSLPAIAYPSQFPRMLPPANTGLRFAGCYKVSCPSDSGMLHDKS